MTDRVDGQCYAIKPAAVFHPLTPFYDVGCASLGLGAGFKRWLASYAAIDPTSHRVLDVACGTGVLLDVVGATRCSGVDADPRALAIARRRLASRASLVAARAEELPFDDRTFERVLCTLALHHLPDPFKPRALGEMRRVLEPDGLLLLGDFDNFRRRWVPSHFRSGRRLDVWLREAGFAAERVAERRLVHVYVARPA